MTKSSSLLNSAPDALDLFGRYTLPVDSEPLENGMISVSGGKIVHIGKRPLISRKGNNLVLIPGLVNAHTHLDLTDMRGEAGKGESFTAWIMEVIAWRAGKTEAQIRSSIKRGVNLLLQSGTTCLGDYSQTGDSFLPLNNAGMKGRVFFEITGFREDVARDRLRKLTGRLDLFKRFTNPLPGVAPHAPYSVSPGLIKSSAYLSKKKRVPVSMHVAETREEIDFLSGKSGDLDGLLKKLNAWENKFKTPGKGAVEYLNDLGVLDQMSLVHLNYITPGEVALLREKGCSAIFCPGSHRWFNRERRPSMRQLLNSGVNVALGSDGLSSNDSLDMFKEMRILSKMFCKIPREDILEMATLNGAKALGLDHLTGSLTVGKDADMVGITCPEWIGNPLDLLFDESMKIKFVMIKGKIVHGALR